MNRYARHKARAMVVQALYQWQITGDGYAAIEEQFAEHLNPRKVEVAYFKRVLMGCLAHHGELLQLVTTLAQREMERLNLVERSAMLLAAYELKFNLDVPYEVVIDEALELDKKFGSAEGYRVVNAVLDQAAQQLRSEEYKRRNKGVKATKAADDSIGKMQTGAAVEAATIATSAVMMNDGKVGCRKDGCDVAATAKNAEGAESAESARRPKLRLKLKTESALGSRAKLEVAARDGESAE